MLENMKNMLNCAKNGKYAVAQFNINNLEWTRFILEECQANNSPVILGVSEGAPFKAGFYQTFASLFGASLKKEYDPEDNDALTERVILMVESGQL